jgi:hypothetical protein
MRLLLDENRGGEHMAKRFERGYPHLSLELALRAGRRSVGVWTAIVRRKDGGQVVASGVRRHQALAIGAALAGIPEMLRRTPIDRLDPPS